MALVVFDRVQETTATTGTGTITLGGAVAGYQSFAVVGNGNTTFYCILNGANWEVGIGTYSTTGPTLARTTVLSNSLGTTSPITLVGASSVFITYPSEKSVNQDATGAVNILTYVPNTTTTTGTLNVGDGTYNISASGQIASFAAADPVVNGINVQNTSTSNTAYSAIQVGADNFGTGYYLQIGTNSSTYSYSAAGYPNSSINQPNTHYILANKADLGIATWDADDIHFIQNASVATVDSMTLYADGGISLGGLANPGLGNIACNNINLKFQQVLTTGGTTLLTNASPYFTQFTGTSTHAVQLPDATTCLVGTTFVFDNDSTQDVTIKNGAGASYEVLVPGGYHNIVLEDNSTIAGTWIIYSSVPSTVEWGTYSLQLGATVITGGFWQGNTVQPAYGGTGITTFTAANNALYSSSASTLTAGTLPVAAGGTGQTTNTLNGVLYGSGTSPIGSTSAGTTGQVLIATTGSAPSWGSVPTTAAVTSLNFGTTGLTPATATTGAITVAGTLAIANGGTGATSAATARTALGATTLGSNLFTITNPSAVTFPRFNADNTVSSLARQDAMDALAGSVTSGQYLRGNGTDVVMSAIQAADVPTLNQNTTGTAAGLSATLVATSGGTGQSSYAVGDLLYASTTTALSKLADVATGNALISGGVGVAPSWGKIGLTTHVSGTLPIANGGTNSTATATAGGVTYGTGTAYAFTSAGTAGQILQSNGASAPTWINNTVGTVTSVATSGTVSGLTLTGGTITTTGTITLGGTLAVTASNFSSQAANTFLAAPNGAAGVPTFRNIVAADVPTLNQNTTGSSGSCTGNSATATTATNQSGGTVSATSITTNGAITASGSANYSFGFSHGNWSRVILPAGNNGAGTGDAALYQWISEPAATWTGAAIARNRLNTSASFPRVNTTLSGQMMRFGEGTDFYFSSIDTSNVTRTPLTLNGNDATVAGTCTATTFIGALSGNATTATTATNLSGGTVSATTVQATGGFTATSAAPFYLNATTVSSNFTVPASYNAMSAGPITVNTGITVTVSTGSSWVIV